MRKKWLLMFALIILLIFSACTAEEKAEGIVETERIVETEHIAEIAPHSSLDLSQEGRQPIPIEEYYKPFVGEILEKDSLVVGMIEEDRPPFFYYTGDGSMDGLDVEISLGIANSFGVELVIDRTARSNQELCENLARGKYDMVLSKLSMTPERAMGISFSAPYVTLRQSFLVNKKLASQYGVTEYPYDYLRKAGAVIGTVEGTSYESFVRQSFPEADIRVYQDIPSMIDAVVKEEVFAAVYDDLTFVQAIMKNYEISLYSTIYTVEDLRDYICAAVGDGSEDLLECINAYLMVNCYSYVLDDLIRDFPECFH